MKILNAIILALVSACSFGQKAPVMFLRNASHEGNTDSQNFTGIARVAWTFPTGGKVNSSPVIHDNLIYFGSGDGNLYAIEVGTGKERWRFKTGGPVHSTPAIYSDVVCFLSFDGNFYAVNAGDGKELWHFRTGGEKWYGQTGLWGLLPKDLFMEDLFQYWLSSPVIDAASNTVCFGSSDHHLYALDIRNGKLKWKFLTEGPIHTSPACHDGLVFIGSWDRNIYSVDLTTGEERWRFATKRDDSGWGGMQGLQASPIVYRGKVYCGSRDGSFYALDEKSGALSWEYKTGGTWILGSATAADGRIFVGTSDTFKLLVLDAKNGDLIKDYTSNGYLYGTPVLSGKYAFFGTFTGKVVSVDIDTPGKIVDEWQTDAGKRNAAQVLKAGKIDFGYLFEGLDSKTYEGNKLAVSKLDQLGPIVSTPLISGGRLYVGSGDGNLYCFELEK